MGSRKKLIGSLVFPVLTLISGVGLVILEAEIMGMGWRVMTFWRGAALLAAALGALALIITLARKIDTSAYALPRLAILGVTTVAVITVGVLINTVFVYDYKTYILLVFLMPLVILAAVIFQQVWLFKKYADFKERLIMLISNPLLLLPAIFFSVISATKFV